MNLSSAIEPGLSPTLRAASVRLSRQVAAAPERLFDAWLNADEARSFLFADRIGNAIRVEIEILQDGGRAMAVGHPGPNGTLSALAIVQPPGWPAGAHSSVSVKNCSSTAINHEIMALAYGA